MTPIAITMHEARNFGNDSCPATHFTKGYTDSRQHTFCYGPYATGELGANISSRLGLCCNGTDNQSQAAPVEVVLDPLSYQLPETGNCWFKCNATYLEGERAHGGELVAFSELEHCVQRSIEGYDPRYLNGSEGFNPYHIFCTPRQISDGTRNLAQHHTSKLGLGLLALITFAIVST